MNQVELMGRVASAAVKATLAATGARPVRPTSTTRPSRTASAAASIDRERLALAVHEAGHAVAGVVLGAELSTVVVPPEGMTLAGGRKGEARFSTRPHGTDERIVYAGPWAEAKFAAGNQRPTQRQFYDVLNGHGCHDQRALVAAGGIHEGAAVQPILDRCWPAVQTVARKLYHDWEASHLDVCAALGITDGGGYYSSQLASLRSGCRSVPPYTPVKAAQPA